MELTPSREVEVVEVRTVNEDELDPSNCPECGSDNVLTAPADCAECAECARLREILIRLNPSLV